LIDDEIYYDSLGVLKLKLAEGFEYDEDIQLAEATYEEVAVETENKRLSAQAYYNLGLIYQYDYDDLVKAKEYYDEAVRQSRTSEAGSDALIKSSDIGKLDIYARTLNIDSTTTQMEIDNAAHTQYLSELYWFKLNKPDSAMLEMQYLIDSFPSAFEVPKAMVALSEMYREHNNDTATADSILNQVLTDHAHSDYAIEALDILGLRGTEADTGYAYVYLSRAEEFLDSMQIDSARANYQYIVDNLPDSRYYLHARFALIWLTEMYESPGDSSVIFAYNEFVDSFPNTEWAVEARRRTSYTPRPAYREEADTTLTLPEEGTDQFAVDVQTEQESEGYVDPMSGIYITPEGDSIINLPPGVEPIVTDIEFEFPVEAARLEGVSWEFYFQILFDFSGEVIDYKLVNPSPVTILNQKLEETVSSMTFDITNIPLDIRERWFVYKYTVIKPEHLR
jgi:TPR repeat protein